jgi:hypothetical protein
MQNSFVIKSLSVLTLLSISVTGAMADNHNHSSSHSVIRTNNNGRVTVVEQHSNNGRAYGHYKNKHKYRNNNRNHRDRQIVINTNNNSNWNWDRHNWIEQRQYMRDNWRARRARMSALQQQQLDAQLRAQYLAYKNNQYNGPYSWDMYSDPSFLDYVQTRNPSLLTTIRSVLGF